MASPISDLIDWTIYTETRAALGPDFVRLLGYFREDGTRSVREIEAAMRTKDATQIVMPAHSLKGESGQFGATRLSNVAEQIEFTARKCIEHRQEPDEILELVAGLRSLFEETLAILERESSPVVQRQADGFGRRQASISALSPPGF